MQGKNNSESGAEAGLGLILKCALMFFNNTRRDWQAEAGSKIFRREKRIEQSPFILRLNPFARVNDFQNHNVHLPVIKPFFIAPRAQGYGSIFFDAVGGILDQVD